MIWELIAHCLIIIEWLGGKRVLGIFCVNFVEMLSCILFDKVSFVLEMLRMQKKKLSYILLQRWRWWGSCGIPSLTYLMIQYLMFLQIAHALQ